MGQLINTESKVLVVVAAAAAVIVVVVVVVVVVASVFTCTVYNNAEQRCV